MFDHEFEYLYCEEGFRKRIPTLCEFAAAQVFNTYKNNLNKIESSIQILIKDKIKISIDFNSKAKIKHGVKTPKEILNDLKSNKYQIVNCFIDMDFDH